MTQIKNVYYIYDRKGVRFVKTSCFKTPRMRIKG